MLALHGTFMTSNHSRLDTFASVLYVAEAVTHLSWNWVIECLWSSCALTNCSCSETHRVNESCMELQSKQALLKHTSSEAFKLRLEGDFQTSMQVQERNLCSTEFQIRSPYNKWLQKTHQKTTQKVWYEKQTESKIPDIWADRMCSESVWELNSWIQLTKWEWGWYTSMLQMLNQWTWSAPSWLVSQLMPLQEVWHSMVMIICLAMPKRTHSSRCCSTYHTCVIWTSSTVSTVSFLLPFWIFWHYSRFPGGLMLDSRARISNYECSLCDKARLGARFDFWGKDNLCAWWDSLKETLTLSVTSLFQTSHSAAVKVH